MSGTSCDGIDVVAIEFSDISFKLHSHLHVPFSNDNIKRDILYLNENESNQYLKNINANNSNDDIDKMCQLDVQLGREFGNAALLLIRSINNIKYNIKAIGCHGQTIRHNPNHVKFPFSCQIGDPNTIVSITNCTVVADFRRKDIAYKGQGAPLVPLFHKYLLKNANLAVSTCNIKNDMKTLENNLLFNCIINLGGFSNFTCYSNNNNDEILTGYDVGPGNCLIDGWTQKHLNLSYDNKGNWARSGEVDTELLNILYSHSFFSKPPPKSTGREEFNINWLIKQINILKTKQNNKNSLKAQDVSATLIELTAKSIGDGIFEHIIKHPHYNINFNSTAAAAAATTDTDTATDNIKKPIVTDTDNIKKPIVVTIYCCGGGCHNLYLIERIKRYFETLIQKYNNSNNNINMILNFYNSTKKLGIDSDWIEASAFAWFAKNTLNSLTSNEPSVTGATKKVILGAIYPC